MKYKVDRNGRFHDERGRFMRVRGLTPSEVREMVGKSDIRESYRVMTDTGKRRMARLWLEYEMREPLLHTKGRFMKRLFCHTWLFTCRVRGYTLPIWGDVIDVSENIIEHYVRISSNQPFISNDEILEYHADKYPEHEVIRYSYYERMQQMVMEE